MTKMQTDAGYTRTNSIKKKDKSNFKHFRKIPVKTGKEKHKIDRKEVKSTIQGSTGGKGK